MQRKEVSLCAVRQTRWLRRPRGAGAAEVVRALAASGTSSPPASCPKERNLARGREECNIFCLYFCIVVLFFIVHFVVVIVGISEQVM